MKAAMAENLKEAPANVTGWYARGRQFLSEVRNEMGRVSWPTRREVWATTIVVILTSAIFGLYLFFVDLGLSNAIGWVFRRFGA
ncbi:MAG: preprotein translocase subunit SecE [Acidobacteria bacterium 37-65-4]|nr:MAG: preprotein translocase subunit SecE [Acidobacteria bacterium 37-65-4]